MALFADAGKVAARFQDLDLRDLTKTYGIGLTLHTPNRTLTRQRQLQCRPVEATRA